MLVDWFIVLAQIINFLVLIALLHWLLYRPLLAVIRERQAAIRQEQAAIERMHQEAESERTAQRQAREALEVQRQGWLNAARGEVEVSKRQALEEMAEQLREQRASWLRELNEARGRLLGQIRTDLLLQVQRVARRALADLATRELEDQMLDRFMGQLAGLQHVEGDGLGSLSGRGQLELQTSFPLSDAQRARVLQALRALSPDLESADLLVRQNRDLICGVELRAPGAVASWNLDHYLRDFEQRLSTAVAQEEATLSGAHAAGG